MNDIRAVVWDMGGVLLLTDADARSALAARYGLTALQLEELIFRSESGLRTQLGLTSREEHWKWVGESLKISGDELLELEQCFWDGEHLDRETLAFVRSLRPAYTVALLSNAWADTRERVTARFGFLDAFDLVIYSAEVGVAKPDPKIFSLALDRLGIPAEKVVFIDDDPRNVEAACYVGMRGVLFQRGSSALSLLTRLLGLYPRQNGV